MLVSCIVTKLYKKLSYLTLVFCIAGMSAGFYRDVISALIERAENSQYRKLKSNKNLDLSSIFYNETALSVVKHEVTPEF